MHCTAKATVPALRGYQSLYRPDEINHCPGCGAAQWIIGRMVAECAFCSTAVPLVAGGMTGTGLFRHGEVVTPLAA